MTVKLFSKPDNDTWLSALDGEALVSIDQLPSFLIEVHSFPDGTTTEAFVQGLTYVGLGNSIVFDWDVGTTTSNQIVIIGRLDEDRPAGTSINECLKFVEHSFGKHDSAAIASHLKQMTEEREIARRKAEADVKPIIDAFVAVGGSIPTGVATGFVTGSDWTRVFNSQGDLHTIHFKDAGGPYSISTSCDSLFQSHPQFKELVLSILHENGIKTDEDGFDVEMDGIATIQEVVELSEKITTVLKRAEEVKKAAILAAYVATIRMTPKRKKLLAAAHSMGGLSIYDKRRNTRARVGEYDIGQTEINELTTAGWIERGGRGFVVTAKGIKVADIKGAIE